MEPIFVPSRDSIEAKGAGVNVKSWSIVLATMKSVIRGVTADAWPRRRTSGTIMPMTPKTTEGSSMARFEIEQYELHVATYEVEARSTAEAIKRVLDGDGEITNCSEYVGICDHIGMSLEDAPKLAEGIRALGVEVRECMIPSVRSARRLDASEGN